MDVCICVCVCTCEYKCVFDHACIPNRGRGALRERYPVRPLNCICVGGELYEIKIRYVHTRNRHVRLDSTIHSEFRMILHKHSVLIRALAQGIVRFSYNAPIIDGQLNDGSLTTECFN